VSQLQGRVSRNNLTFIIQRNEFARTSFFSNNYIKTKLPEQSHNDHLLKRNCRRSFSVTQYTVNLAVGEGEEKKITRLEDYSR
jgi:hypothetical protein